MRYIAPSVKREFQMVHDLTDLSPHANTIREGVAILKDAYGTVGHRGRYTRMGGFDPHMVHQRVASLDPLVFFELERIDPDLFRDKPRFYAWLDQYGAEFDTRRKVD